MMAGSLAACGNSNENHQETGSARQNNTSPGPLKKTETEQSAYCETNNSMAIFYAQTDQPDLAMEVIPIGKATPDLSVFDTFGNPEDVTFTITE